MSVKKMAEIWECDISAPWQQILLAMADLADDDGKNLFPSAAYLEWKTGKSERQVRALLADLRKAKVLKVLRPAAQHRTISYQLDLSTLPKKTPWETLQELRKQARAEVSAGLEQSRDEKSAGLRPEETAPLENPDLQFSAPEVQSSVARPEAGCTLSEEIHQLEEEGEGRHPRHLQKLSTENGDGWPKEDPWLLPYLDTAELPYGLPREYVLKPRWWRAVRRACGGLSKDFLDSVFGALDAAIVGGSASKPKNREEWEKTLRAWLVQENRIRQERRKKKAVAG